LKKKTGQQILNNNILRLSRRDPAWGRGGIGGLVPVGGARWQGKRLGGWIWCKFCVHTYVNAKMIPVETIPGMGERGIKEEG
jgi:hypothetical protein